MVIQARMGSQRFPQKVLADLNGRPMLAHVVERARAIRGVDDVVLAVPHVDVEPIFAALAPLSDFVKPAIVSGPLHDVLGRFMVVVEDYRPDVLVRLTGDCPIFSPALATFALSLQRDGYDYVSTTRPDPASQYPDGFDVEVVTRAALETAHAEATGDDREHVLSYVWARPARFRSYGMRRAPMYDWARNLKLSVDTPEDLARVRAIHARIPPGDFSLGTTLTAAKEVGL